MIDGIHGHPAHDGPPPQPSISSSFSQRDIFMLKIAHLADGGIAILEDQSDFPRWEFDMSILPLFCHQLATGSCTSNDLTPLPYFQFDIMNQRARRDISEGKGIPRFNIR
jgi:hypothetical protein